MNRGKSSWRVETCFKWKAWSVCEVDDGGWWWRRKSAEFRSQIVRDRFGSVGELELSSKRLVAMGRERLWQEYERVGCTVKSLRKCLAPLVHMVFSVQVFFWYQHHLYPATPERIWFHLRISSHMFNIKQDHTNCFQNSPKDYLRQSITLIWYYNQVNDKSKIKLELQNISQQT